MLVTYKPEDGAEKVWEFRPGRVRQSEAALIEKASGETYEQWSGAVQAGSMRARRVLLWHLIRREHPRTRLDDTPDFYTDELVVEHSADELRVARDRIAAAAMDEGEKAQALAMIDGEIVTAEARESEPSGKAPSTASA